MPPVVDIHHHARIVQHVAVDVLEVTGVREDPSGKVRDLDTPDRRMQRRRVGRVACAKADHQNGLRGLNGEKRNMGERTHVALREARRRRHRMPIGEQRASLARLIGHGDDLGEAFAQGHLPLGGGARQRPGNHVVRGQTEPQAKPGSANDDRGRQVRRRTTVGRLFQGRRTAPASLKGSACRRRRAETVPNAGVGMLGSARREKERNHRERGGDGQRRGAALYPEPWEEDEAGRQRAAHRAGRVGKIENARPAGDRVLRALDDGIGERKAESHQERRYGDLQQDRSRVEPQLGEGSRPSGLRAQHHLD